MAEIDILRKLLERLKDASRSKNTTTCLQIIAEISEYFDSPKNPVEIRKSCNPLLLKFF